MDYPYGKFGDCSFSLEKLHSVGFKHYYITVVM